MRKKAMIASAASLIAFAAISYLTVSGRFYRIDSSFCSMVYSLETPALTVIFKIITNLGGWQAYLLYSLFLIAIPKYRHKIGIQAASTLSISALSNAFLKRLFKIPRPVSHQLVALTGFGFPSGHSMNAMAFIGAIAFLSMKGQPRMAVKSAVFALAALFILSVGLSRIYLGAHSLSDVLGGYSMGLCLLSASLSIRWGEEA